MVCGCPEVQRIIERLKLSKSVLSVLFVLYGVGAQAQGKAYYCEGKGAANLDNRKQTSSLKAWMKGPNKFRIEETVNQKSVITICDGVHIWLLGKADKKGVHRLRTPQEVAAMTGKLRVIGDDLDGFRKQGARFSGKETIEGILCDRYEMRKEGLVHRIWVIPGTDRLTKRRLSYGKSQFSTGPGQPMRSHTLRREITYNWKTNVAMPGSLFKVPSGYRVQETQAAPPPVFAPGKRKR